MCYCTGCGDIRPDGCDCDGKGMCWDCQEEGKLRMRTQVNHGL
jgi:sugar lactone lactonase YvrE